MGTLQLHKKTKKTDRAMMIIARMVLARESTSHGQLKAERMQPLPKIPMRT
jgi:hypothetical protein